MKRRAGCELCGIRFCFSAPKVQLHNSPGQRPRCGLFMVSALKARFKGHLLDGQDGPLRRARNESRLQALDTTLSCTWGVAPGCYEAAPSVRKAGCVDVAPSVRKA